MARAAGHKRLAAHEASGSPIRLLAVVRWRVEVTIKAGLGLTLRPRVAPRSASACGPTVARLERKEVLQRKGNIMVDDSVTETRRYHFEQIKASELARGASEDEATRVANETVDKVMRLEEGKQD